MEKEIKGTNNKCKVFSEKYKVFFNCLNGQAYGIDSVLCVWIISLITYIFLNNISFVLNLLSAQNTIYRGLNEVLFITWEVIIKIQFGQPLKTLILIKKVMFELCVIFFHLITCTCMTTLSYINIVKMLQK